MGKLHDLSMHEFYEICIRFNGKLNDLILTPRTYKLVKWVIDKEIAIQQEIQNKTSEAKFKVKEKPEITSSFTQDKDAEERRKKKQINNSKIK